MSPTTNESNDEVLSKGHRDSALVDECYCGGTTTRVSLKKGPWTSEEDAILIDYVKNHGEGNWNAIQKDSRLLRCGKSCRLRWANHLRPDLKKGAFTAEEERLIIELHAELGNKWARMAAHLPGRTDNEIKNFWNTRIKRCQRVGLPLYPPDVCLQASQEKQRKHNSGWDKARHNLLQPNSNEIPDFVFDSLEANQAFSPHVCELPDIFASSMLMKGLDSSPYYSFVPPTVHCQKRLRESSNSFSGYNHSVRNKSPPFEKARNVSCDYKSPSFGLRTQYDSDSVTENLLHFNVNQGGHPLLSGKLSGSKFPLGALKSELPSIQYSETDLSSWRSSSPAPLLEPVDALIHSSLPFATCDSDCLSPSNSGLLDALLYEAKILSSTKNLLPEKGSNSSTATPSVVSDGSAMDLCVTKWEDYCDPISPLGNSAASIFSECTPGGGSSFNESVRAESFAGIKVKSEAIELEWALDGENKESLTQLDFSRPDVLLNSCWFG